MGILWSPVFPLPFLLLLICCVLSTPSRTLDGLVSKSAIAGPQNEILEARKIVAVMQIEMSRMNKARLDARSQKFIAPRSPVFEPSSRVRRAASLVAEADAMAEVEDNYLKWNPHQDRREETLASDSFWLPKVSHMGTMPWGGDTSYKVFRNVMDYGTRGDGLTDDSDAIERAMSDGNRCVNEYCHGSTTKNAIVYFPPGIYLVSRPIVVGFATAMIGDAKNWPTIKGASSFLGLGVVSTNGEVPYIERMWTMTANFYRQIRNFRIDITATPQDSYVCAIHHQMGQATSLQYIELISTNNTNTTQQGIFMEDGSGGVMSDITFRGGNIGMYVGNQQFTSQRLRFEGVNTAIQLCWDWTWTFKSLYISNCNRGIVLTRKSGIIGAVAILDSSFVNTPKGILIDFPSTRRKSNSTSLILDNVVFTGVQSAIEEYKEQDGEIGGGGMILSGTIGALDLLVNGVIYDDSATRTPAIRSRLTMPRSKELVGNFGGPFPKSPYFERARPQYEDVSPEGFVHMKSYAKADGQTDDTAAFQRALDENAGTAIIYVDAGIYLLSDTITVPSGTKIVGEAWSQIMAYGQLFSDALSPRALFRVGRPNERGNVELQDLLFTTQGATAGLVAVEWNMRGDAAGSAGMWDCHVRIGGAAGTQLTPDACPALHSGSVVDAANADACAAASLMLHVAPGASGYFENVWLWVADHLIDDADLRSTSKDMVQTSVYAARGVLVETDGPVWLYGTSAEHAVFYQYNFHRAKNVFAALIQTESPYFQPLPRPPAPFGRAAGKFAGDWNYDECALRTVPGCDASWALIIRESENVHIAGAGLYSWFRGYEQDCIAANVTQPYCQTWLAWTSDNSANVTIQNLVTIGSEAMLIANGTVITAEENRAVSKQHPFWSTVALFHA